jgi:hypothetical protein
MEGCESEQAHESASTTPGHASKASPAPTAALVTGAGASAAAQARPA